MDYFELSKDLEEHHSLFYMMWELGKPIYTKSIPTAAVGFDKEGEFIKFMFNPDFWDGLSKEEKLFVISHECLHVILNHGIRARDGEDRSRANRALDVVVNHMLVDKFDFKREDITDSENLCWVDTVFPDRSLPTNETFEYYYQRCPETPIIYVRLVDDHGKLAEGAEELGALIDKLNENLSEEDKNNLKDIIEQHFEQNDEKEDEGHSAGDSAGGQWTFAEVGKVRRKKKWETVIKKWSKRFNKTEVHDVEQWSRINRRFALIGNDLMLPSDMEMEKDAEGRIQVWFFQDTSGSCAELKDRLFAAALSLPPERFDVKMHCFDTQVYETSLESKKLYGFGGTTFQPLEDYIQGYIKKHTIEYPKAVFVLTDGYGSAITPEKPKAWYWFLTTNYKNHVPADCNTYSLTDFE